MNMRFASLVLLTALIASPACLTDRSGQTIGVTGDVADTTDSADSALTCPGGCDDGDPCTVDSCVDGQCMHFAEDAMKRAPGCIEDADCDDGDPCTEDRCRPSLADSCYPDDGYCEQMPIQGCDFCTPAGCDDGDPCTIDTCDANDACRHEEADGCYGKCNGKDVQTVADVVYGGDGQTWVKTVGEVGIAWQGQSCDDGPECRCEGSPGLNGSGEQLRLSSGGDSDGIQWHCTSRGCDEVEVVCGAPVWGARYWMWGRPSMNWSRYSNAAEVPGDPSEAPRPAFADILSVEGYCLATTPDALPGTYEMTAEILGETISTKARMMRDANGALRLRIRSTDCDICPGGRYPDSDAPVSPGDGWVGVELPMPGSGLAEIPISATLFSDKSVLRGALQMGTGSQGTLTLRRL